MRATPLRAYKWIRPLPAAAIVVALAHIILALVLPARTMIILLDAVAISFCVTVFIVYRTRLWQGFTHHNPDVYDLLICGIALGWATNALDRSWRLASRVLDQPWMLESEYIPPVLTGLAFCAGLHLIVRGHATVSGGGGDADMRRIVTSDAWALLAQTLFIGTLLGIGALWLDHNACLVDVTRCR